MDAIPWTIKKTAKNAFVINVDFPTGGLKMGDTWKCLLSFDRHHDNPKANQALEKAHLERVKKLGTLCLDGGDLFCAMQGKYDRRSDKSDIRPEHQNGEYLDSLVNTAADFFEPYADVMPVFGLGNHETAILKAHETNLTDRLVHSLKERTGAICHMGGYSTWIKFQFRFVNDDGKRVVRDSKTLWMFHGSGGDAPMSFGTLNVKRQGSIIPDADIIATGHSHNEFVVPLPRARLSKNGIPYLDEQLHIKVPTYKEEDQKGVRGCHVERGAPPKPQGATWLVFNAYRPIINEVVASTPSMYCDTERAK